MRQVRGWKLFLVLPRLLLHRPLRGKVGREKLVSRFQCSAGQWADLLRASLHCSAQNSKWPRYPDEPRGEAGSKVLTNAWHERCSWSRQVLEGADLAPGSEATLHAHRNPARRPNRLGDPSLQSLHTVRLNWTRACSARV